MVYIFMNNQWDAIEAFSLPFSQNEVSKDPGLAVLLCRLIDRIATDAS